MVPCGSCTVEKGGEKQEDNDALEGSSPHADKTAGEEARWGERVETPRSVFFTVSFLSNSVGMHLMLWRGPPGGIEKGKEEKARGGGGAPVGLERGETPASERSATKVVNRGELLKKSRRMPSSART